MERRGTSDGSAVIGIETTVNPEASATAVRDSRSTPSRLKHFPLYRIARIALSVARVLPRYWYLMLRELWLRQPVSQRAWDRAHDAAAEQIRLLALTLEAGLIKAAQIGGARADILPKPFIEKLSRFHDDVPARPLADLVSLVESELGAPLASIFASVDERPLGAASLAQVHRARLLDGADVVIKIQYPEARRVIPVDLAMLRRVARLVQSMQSNIDVRAIVNEITRFVEMELDFRREARSTSKLGAILERRGDVRVPRIYEQYTRDRVVVMEYLEGIQVTRTQALREAGHKPSEVARRIGEIYGAMLFEYGFFHGDPHPGNLLVLPDGRIGLLDFGLCKELPANFARSIAQMMVAALIGDSAAALEAASSLSFDIDEIQPEHLRSLMLSLMGDSTGDADLATVLGATRIRKIPDDFGLVLRTMLLLNGLSHRLAPGRRLIQAELLKHLAAGAAAATA